MKTLLVFTVWAFDDREPIPGGKIFENTQIEIFAESAAEALKKAKALIIRKEYMIFRIQEQIDIADLNMQLHGGAKKPWEKD